MSLRYKLLSSITEQDLQDLITNEVGEGRDLEYKQQIDFELEQGKAEKKQAKVDLLAAISSFANTDGGDIIFGIRENRTTGLPEEICGVEIQNEDALIRDIEAVVRDGLDPRIPSITYQTVKLTNPDKVVFIIRVGRSFAAPHMISLDKMSRFYGRGTKGKYPMDVRQIKAAFELSGAITDKARNFRSERLAKITSSDTPVSLPDGAKLVLHIIPLTAFDAGAASLNLNNLDSSEQGVLRQPLIGYSTHPRYNFDGHLTYQNSQQDAPFQAMSYLQLFRNGIIEVVDTEILLEIGNGNITSIYEKYVVESLVRYLKLLQILNISTPIFIMLSFLNVKDYTFYGGPLGLKEPIDRHNLIVPEVLFDSISIDVNTIATAMHFGFDMVWNAGGKSGSPNFDSEGNWKPVGS